MVVAFFLQRFIAYFLATTSLLTIISLIIEFFEVAMRSSSLQLKKLLIFSLLSVIPTWFFFVLVGIMLAPVFVLREFSQQGEMEALWLVGIRPLTLLCRLAQWLLVVVAALFLLKEYCAVPLQERVLLYKQEVLKKADKNTIKRNQWYRASDEKFIFAQTLDAQAGDITNVLVLDLNDSIHDSFLRIGFSNNAHVALKDKKISLFNPIFFDDDAEIPTQQKEVEFAMPPHLIDQIARPINSLSLRKACTLLKSSLPTSVFMEMTQVCIEQMLFCIPIVFMPLWSLGLFFLYSHVFVLRWIVLFIPYLWFIFLDLLIHWLFQHTGNWLVCIVSYVVLTIFITLYIYRRLRKES